MASSDFLVFAGASGANVVSQSTYASMAALTSGFQTGIANSNQLNKTWRQASIMAASLGQIITGVLGQNATDDGTLSLIPGNLLSSILKADYVIDTGAANAYTLTLSPALIFPLTDGASYAFQAANANTGASTVSVNGSPAKALVGMDYQALTGGEIVAGGVILCRYNAARAQFIMLDNAGGVQKAITPAPGDSSTKVATTAFVAQTSSIGGSGYMKFSNGVILQWKSVVAGATTGTFTWPLTFPNNLFAAAQMTFTAGGGYVSLTGQSTSGATWNLGGTSATSFWVIAIGN